MPENSPLCPVGPLEFIERSLELEFEHNGKNQTPHFHSVLAVVVGFDGPDDDPTDYWAIQAAKWEWDDEELKELKKLHREFVDLRAVEESKKPSFEDMLKRIEELKTQV